MTKLYIQQQEGEMIFALFKQNTLLECFIDSGAVSSSTGNIYRGKVRRRADQMQAAFIEIGQDKPALLSARDIVNRQDRKNQVADIGSSINEGQIVWVQVIKDAVYQGIEVQKGPRVTTNLHIQSPWFVYFPNSENIAASHKVKDSQLKSIRIGYVESKLQQYAIKGGIIIRTAAFELDDENFFIALESLLGMAETFLQSQQKASHIGLVWSAQSVEQQVLRLCQNGQFDQVISNIKLDDSILPLGSTTLRDAEIELQLQQLNFNQQLDAALNSELKLSEGGSVVFEKTEALTSIDINLGTAVDKNFTLLEFNLLAAREVVKQIRLRNLSGIIMVDFINMDSKKADAQLVDEIKSLFLSDSQKVVVHGMTRLGLLEISRNRSRSSLSAMTQFSTLLSRYQT